MCFSKTGKLFFCVIILCSSLLNFTVQGSSEPNYNWIYNARIFLLDGYAYPFRPNIEFDANGLSDLLVDMNMDTVRIATSEWYYLIPDTPFKTNPQLNGRDILAETIAACKPKGIRVVAYVRAGGPLGAEVVKPEWAHRKNPQGEIYYQKQPYGEITALCWNTSYRQAFLEFIEHLVTHYDIDGVYFDSWQPFYAFYLQGGFPEHPRVKGLICYCEGCKKGFKQATGLDIPYSEKGLKGYTEQELKTLERYEQWYIDQMVEAFYQAKKIIKSHKNIPLIYNIYGPIVFEYADRRIMNGHDAFLYERGNTLVERAESVSVAVAHRLAVWPFVGGFDGLQRIVHDWYNLQQEAYVTAAFGGSPVLYQGYMYLNHPEGRKPVKEAFGVLKKNEKYISGFKPYKYCAVVHTRKNPPGHAVEIPDRYSISTRLCSLGAFSACIYNHLQATSLFPDDLDNPEILKQYKILYLPDMCYVSPSRVENIKNYVKNGGGLVFSYCTSLYEANGNKKHDFGLAEIAGIKYLDPNEKVRDMIANNYRSGGPWDLYLKGRKNPQVIRSSLNNQLLAGYLYEPVELLPSATTAVDLVTGTDERVLYPGVTVSNYGKGKVAYIAPAVDALYAQTHIKEVGDFLVDVMSYVSSQPRPYDVNAPDLLMSNMTSNGSTAVIHLINLTGCNFEKPLQKIYYVPPINDVRVQYRIPEGKKVKKVELFVKAKFSQNIKNGMLYIKLPRVDNYQAVAIETE